MNIPKKRTRFRAYQLKTEGSSFSYFDGDAFTLIEARCNEHNCSNICDELGECDKSRIDSLHITSWDEDHCAFKELEEILDTFTPKRIEYPGYEPKTENGKHCLSAIYSYNKKEWRWIVKVNPEYIRGLKKAEALGYQDILYNPLVIMETSNDNSTIKFFRKGSFNVISLGDVESPMIRSRLERLSIFNSEIDVMILSHHGADNGFTTKSFLSKTKPTVAIASANYENEYEHPRKSIRNDLYELNIPIFTSKTGDVIIESTGDHTGSYRVTNLKSDSTDISSQRDFKSKKASKLTHNADSIRNHYNPKRPFYRF